MANLTMDDLESVIQDRDREIAKLKKEKEESDNAGNAAFNRLTNQVAGLYRKIKIWQALAIGLGWLAFTLSLVIVDLLSKP